MSRNEGRKQTDGDRNDDEDSDEDDVKEQFTTNETVHRPQSLPPSATWPGLRPHHCVHVGLGPDDVVVVVDDHRPAEHVQVLHDVLLHVGQGGDVCVVA